MERKNWMPTCWRTKLHPYLSPCTTINSKGTEDFSLEAEILNLLGEHSHALRDAGVERDLLNRLGSEQNL